MDTTGHGTTIDPTGFEGLLLSARGGAIRVRTNKKGEAKMSFSDITLTCKDCGNPFVFTAGEQEFYQQRGLMNQPGRCSDCRAVRKATGGGASYGGKEARVPFQPRGDKPVYCSSCFETRRPASRY
jgi:CxxC-x17-CxxC domain-containing protein